jgi:hypothetical protein
MANRLSFALGLAIFFAASHDLCAQTRSLGYFTSPPRIEEAVIVAAAPVERAFTLSIPMSPNTSMPLLEHPQGGDNIGLAQLAIESSQYLDPSQMVYSRGPGELNYWDRLKVESHHLCGQIVQDYKNFYLTENMLYLGAALVVAAPLANTDADQGIRDWYQRGAGRSKGANDTADVFKVFGHWQYVVPVYLGLGLGGHLFPDSPTAATLGQFSMRTLRAMAVGAPTVGVLQVGLGAGRPYTLDSHWHPFNHANSVAGHGFVGAVPFLTAAAMTDRPLLKALFFAGSFGTGWSRIQHDDHYFSQVVLGWAIAYLSVESVNLTELQSRNIQIVPCELPNGVGLGVQFNY